MSKKIALTIKHKIAAGTLTLFLWSVFPVAAQTVDTVRIRETSNFHYNVICQLQVERRSLKTLWLKKTRFTSTGFLIDKNSVLTNAHNVYSNFFSQVVSIEINPGLDDNVVTHEPLILETRKIVKTNVRTAPGYGFMQSGPRRALNDYAFIHLPSPATPGRFLEVGSVEAPDLHNEVLTIIGYPGETESGITNGRRQFKSRGPFHHTDSRNIYYKIWTETGNSGSPVILELPRGPVIIGIHAFANKAVKIDGSVIEQIQRWKNQFIPESSQAISAN